MAVILNMKIRDSILGRILKWSLIAALVPLLANQLAQYFSVRVGLGKSAQERVDLLAEQKFAQIERFLAERKGNVAVLCQMGEIQAAIQATRPAPVRKPSGGVRPAITTASLRQSLAASLSAYDYEDILLVSAAGDLVFSMGNRAELGTNLRTGPHRETTLARAVEMSRVGRATVFSDFRIQKPTGRLALFVVAPLLHGSEVLGFLATEVKGANVLRLVQDFEALGKTGEVVLLAQEGAQMLLLSPLRGLPQELVGGDLPGNPGQQSVARKALSGEAGSERGVDFQGVRCIAWWRYLPATRWGVVVKMDESEAYSRLNSLAKRTVLLTAGAALLAILLSLVATRGISRPIFELKKGVQQIAGGDFHHRVGMTSQDEVGSLSRAFDKMLDRLQEVTASRDELNAEIGRRKKVETDNRRLVLAVRETTNVVLVADAEGRLEWANEAFTRLTGYTVEEVKGKRPGEFLQGSGTDPAAKARIRKSLLRGKGIRTELLNYRKDGTAYWVDINIQPMLDERGQLEGWFAIEVDITERKAAEEELRLHAEKLREQMDENERFNRLASDREHRILELKEQVNSLARELGREPLYETTASELAPEMAAVEPGGKPLPPTSPSASAGSVADLVDKAQLQLLLEEFCRSVGVPGAILDLDGRVLVSSCWRRVCAGGHREGESTCPLCESSGPGVLAQLREGKDQAVYRFPNQLAEAGAMVLFEDQPVATVLVGPFHLQPADPEAIRRQAQRLGLETPEYLAAVAAAPVIAPDRLPSILGFLREFTRLRISASVERLRVREAEAAAARRTEELKRGRAAAMSLAEDAVQARAERARYQENLEQLNAELESRIRQRTADLEDRSRELQRENEERLKAEERSRLILDSAGEGIFGVDVRGKITFVNEAAKQLLGYTDAEMLGQVVHDLIHHSHADGSPYLAETCAMSHSYSHGEPSHRSDEVLWRKDGSFFPVEYSATPMRSERGLVTGAVVVFRDITVRRQMESELITAKESAETATEAKSDFLANMSHEIRTPMNGILGMAHLALRTELTPKQRDYVVKIERSSEQLLSIINDILDFSKIEAGRLVLEKIDFRMEEVLDNLSTLLGGRASEKGLEFLFDSDPRIPAVLVGDPLRLGQILINLASNAVKFTERGQVVIRSRLLQAQGPTVRVRFEVQDTGIGLAAEEKDRLFQAFTQADTSTTRKFGGTGLGLAICRRLVGLMEGEIGVESEPGKGSTFWFDACLQASQEPVGTLPTNPPKADDLAEAAGGVDPAEASGAEPSVVAAGLSPAPQPVTCPLSGTRLLVVEDNAINQQITQEILQARGAEVILADNGRVALERLRQVRCDLVLLDVQMPEMDGYRAAAAIRADPLLKRLPVIAITAHAMPADRERCLAAGMNDYVTKPIDPDLLTETVLRWLPSEPESEDVAPSSPEAAGAGEESAVPAVQLNAPPAEPGAPSASPREGLRKGFPTHLAGIRLAEGLRRLGGSQEVYSRLLQEFARDQGAILDQIQEALDTGDIKSAVVYAHSLKGSAGNLALPELAKTAGALEGCLKNQETLWLNHSFSEVRRALDEVLASIAELPPVEGPEAQPSEQEPSNGPLDAKKAVELLDLLLDRFEAGDLDAKLWLPELVAACGGRFRDEVAAIQHHLDTFEFERAAAAAGQIRDQLNNA